MGQKTIFKNNIIMVYGPNSNDLALSDVNSMLDTLEPGIPINHIAYTSNASRDICVIKEKDENGPDIARFECGSSTDQRIIYFYGARHKPFIDSSAGTHGKTSGSILKIEMC